MLYAAALKKVIDEAKPATGLTRTELEERIAAVSDELKRPLGDAMRIMLCGDRASFRKALAALDH